MNKQMCKMHRTTSLDIILLASDRNYYTMSIFLSHPPVLADYLLSSVSKTQKKIIKLLQNLRTQAESLNDFCLTGANGISTVCNSLLLRSISPLLKNIMTGPGSQLILPEAHINDILSLIELIYSGK